MSPLELARPELLRLAPYSSARMEAGTAEVMLNANEVPRSIDGDSHGLNRYPEPQPPQLVAALAELYGTGMEQTLVCRGSDEAIDLLLRAFCRPGQDAVVISPPTFGMYAVAAGVQGAAVIPVPLEADFKLDPARLLSALSPAVKLVFVCSPNNPSGNVVPLQTVSTLAHALAGRALLVVDEAYIEFADSDSACSLLPQHRNLVVLRTLSKAWALAGARIGALQADPEVVSLLRRIMAPYPLPSPSVAAAMDALSQASRQAMRQRVARIVAERERMAATLATLPGVRRVYPSQANFLTVVLADAHAVYQRLLAQGIVVRDVGTQPGLEACLRISIGTADENNRLLRALEPMEQPA